MTTRRALRAGDKSTRRLNSAPDKLQTDNSEDDDDDVRGTEDVATISDARMRD